MAIHTGEHGSISEPAWLESMSPARKKWIIRAIAVLATATAVGANVYHGLSDHVTHHEPTPKIMPTHHMDSPPNNSAGHT